MRRPAAPALPAAALLAAVGRATGAPRRGWKARLRRQAGKAGVGAYQRAVRDGWVRLPVLERLCDAFGWHPRELYRDAYDRAALAGCPPDYDPWKGVA